MPEPAPAVPVYVAPAGTPPPDGDPADAGWLDLGFVTDGDVVQSVSSYVMDPDFVTFEPGGMVDAQAIARYWDRFHDRRPFDTYLTLDLWQRYVLNGGPAGSRRDSGRRDSDHSFHNPRTAGPAAIDIHVGSEDAGRALTAVGASASRVAVAMGEWIDETFGLNLTVDPTPPPPPPSTPQQPGSYATRATAPRPAADPAGGQAGVDDLTATIEGLCACPCRRRLDPAGASAYFATAACQQRWHSAQATEPDDVYRRTDAAWTSLNDQADPELTTPDPSPAEDRAYRQQADFRRYARSGDLEWRRVCPRCRDTTRPGIRNGHIVAGCRPGPRRSDGTRIVHVDTRPDRWQECTACSHRYPGPPLSARVELADNGDYVMRLTDNTTWTSVTVDRQWFDEQLHAAPTVRRAFVDAVWQHLEQDLLRRAGHGTTTGSERDPVPTTPHATIDEYLVTRQRAFEHRLALATLPVPSRPYPLVTLA